jgi:GDPmannose 4,6-dehydratase
LDSKRDWGHAKDYVRGMWLMLQQEIPDDYVLATGKTYTVREFITAAFAYKNITLQWHKEGLEEYATDQLGNTRVMVNQKYYRPCEVDLLLGDPEKSMNKLGWNREYNDLSSLIEEMFD